MKGKGEMENKGENEMRNEDAFWKCVCGYTFMLIGSVTLIVESFFCKNKIYL